jgi:exodeoxyribonuclease-3
VQLEAAGASPKGWHVHLSAAERPGYSGVALLTRRAPDSIETDLGEARFDREGRLQIARFGRLCVANVYFPNGSGRDRDQSRVPYKLDFYRALFDRLSAERRRGRRVLVMGDFNTAHQPIDLARPKANEKTSGFLPVERAELSRWLDAGYTDTFRATHPGEAGHYSWWSQRQGARARNVGWRIDYVLLSRAALPFLRATHIWPEVLGSDHCPVGVDLDPAILGPRSR